MTAQRAGTPPPEPTPAGQLLSAITFTSLDPGYYRAARRPGSGRTSLQAAIVVATAALLVVGLAVGAAVAQLRAVPSGSSARAILVSEIERRSSAADRIAAGNIASRTTIEDLESDLLADSQAPLTQAVNRLAPVVGAQAVTGPGVRVTLDDPPTDAAAQLLDDESESARVLDYDIQLVVNGLWAAGAEAIAVNGQRLTSTSSIRGAGTAILVDNRPLATPYVVDAVGDRDAMTAEADPGPDSGLTGSFLALLQSKYGVAVSVAGEDGVTVPASASVGRLAHARVATAADVAGSVP